jgi:hypothetical protein
VLRFHLHGTDLFHPTICQFDRASGLSGPTCCRRSCFVYRFWYRLLVGHGGSLNKSARWRVPRLAVAALVIVAAVVWGTSELMTWLRVQRAVGQVSQMTAPQLYALITQPGHGQNRFVLAAIAESSRATPEVLHRIALINRKDLYEPLRAFLPVPSRNRKGLAVMRLVAANPNTSLTDLYRLASEASDEYLRSDLARRKELDENTIRRFAQREQYWIELSLAGNLETPPDLLVQLATNSNENTRAKVAANPAPPKEALHALSTDRVAHVRAQLAVNPSSPDEVIRILSSDRKSMFGWLLPDAHGSAYVDVIDGRAF